MTGNQEIGARIRVGRRALGRSIEWLSTRTGISRSCLSRIERGEQRVTVADADRIARALRIKIFLGDV